MALANDKGEQHGESSADVAPHPIVTDRVIVHGQGEKTANQILKCRLVILLKRQKKKKKRKRKKKD